ncbi:MAG: ABC transporter substrate-binding protein [Nitrospirales bacterium]|nr:ABC transporter substrate-binding protein [Nitrospirales bacterium]
MRQTIEEIRSVFKDAELKKPENREKRNARLRALVDERFDFEEMSKRTLARYWRERTLEERKEFVALYSDLLKDVYLKKIRQHEGEVEKHEEDKVLYQDEKVEDSYASVKTLVVTYDGKEIPVEYRLLKEDGDWQAYDVLVEGVSLLNNYRSQFRQIIRSGSYEELVERIKAKKIAASPEGKKEDRKEEE